MTWTRWIFAAAATTCMGLAAPAAAQTVGWRYEIMWGGFHAGDMAITSDRQDDRVKTGLTIRTVSLFDKIMRLRYAAEGVSQDSGAEELKSEHYQTRFRNRYQEKMLRVLYGGAEAVTVLDEVLQVFSPPPEDKELTPAVPAEAKRGVRDPLTNVALVGRMARQAISGGASKFRLVGYDGLRAYDFDVAVKGARRINIRGRDFDTIETTIVLRPVAGFKPRFQKMWSGAQYIVHLDQDTLLPLRIYTDSFAAATVINAIEPCRVAAEQCAPLLAGGAP